MMAQSRTYDSPKVRLMRGCLEESQNPRCPVTLQEILATLHVSSRPLTHAHAPAPSILPSQSRALQQESKRLDAVVASLRAQKSLLSQSAGAASPPRHSPPPRFDLGLGSSMPFPAGGAQSTEGLLAKSRAMERRLNSLQVRCTRLDLGVCPKVDLGLFAHTVVATVFSMQRQNETLRSTLTPVPHVPPPAPRPLSPPKPGSVAELSIEVATMKHEVQTAIRERDQVITESASMQRLLRAEVDRLQAELAAVQSDAARRVEAAETSAEMQAMRSASELKLHKAKLDQLHDDRMAAQEAAIRTEREQLEQQRQHVLEEGEELQKLIEEYVAQDEELKQAQHRHRRDSETLVAERAAHSMELQSNNAIQDLQKMVGSYRGVWEVTVVDQWVVSQVRNKSMAVLALEKKNSDYEDKIASQQKAIKLMQVLPCCVPPMCSRCAGAQLLNLCNVWTQDELAGFYRARSRSPNKRNSMASPP